MKKKLLPILLACMFGLIACGGDKKPDPTPSTDVAVTGVTLDQSSIELMVGEYKTLTATVQPTNATNKNVTWASDNSSIASVVDGKVTAVAEGSAKIAVTTVDGNKKAECTVTVKPITYSVEITNKADLQAEWMRGGATRSLSLTITPNGNIDQLITSGAITVTSSNPDAVAASGRNLSAKGAGTSKITVTYGNASDSVDITVTGVTYTSIETVFKDVYEHLNDKPAYVSSEYNVKGTVVAILGTKSYVIQSGNYGLYIYATAPDGTKIGDVVGVNQATFTTYNGLIETKKINGSTEILSEAGEEIVPLKLSKLDDLTLEKQNVLASIDGITSIGQSTHAIAGSEYRTAYITDGVTEATTYSIYVNKYLSADTISALNDKLDKLEGKEAGHAYKANLKGMLTSALTYPQFVPQSADEIELIEEAIVNPTAVTITNTETKLQAGKTLQLATSFEPENCNVKGLAWTVDDDTKATVSESGLLTGLAAGNVKVTATSTAVDTVKDEFEIEIFAADYVTEPVAGENYYLAIEQENISKVLYALDEMNGYYGKTTENKADAPYAVLTAGTGENEGKYALKVGSKFIDCVYDGTKYYNYKLVDDAAFLSWDAAKACFYKDFGEDVVKYLGTNNSNVTVSWGNPDKQPYLARLYPSYETKLDESSEYMLGMYHTGLATPGYYFATGGMDGYYGATTQDLSKVATVKVKFGTDANVGKVSLMVGSNYLNIVKNGNYINYVYTGTETFIEWDSFKGSPFVTIESSKYYVGTQGTSTYTTLAGVKEMPNLIYGHLFLKPTIPAPTAITVNGADEVNTNETATYTVTVEPTGANPAVTWSVENGTGEATINASGVLTPSKAGTVTVKATSTVDTSVVGSKDVTLVESTGPAKGSKENPYTVAEVIEATKTLEKGSFFKDGALVYAKGYINTAFTNKGTWCQNVKLADNFGDETIFLAYNPNFTTEVTAVYVGDQVVIGGPIKNYNGTIEFTNNGTTAYPTFESVTHPEYAISVDSESSENATVDLSANKGTNGTEFTFTVTPAEGYLVEAVTVNGKSVEDNEGTYTGTIAGPTKVCVTTKSASEKEPVLLAAFTMGDAPKGATGHTDGSALKEYEEKVGTYTLTLANLSGVYGSACDEKLNGILKLGTSKAIGQFEFTVPSDVTIVKIYVAKYKTNASTVTVAGKDFALTKNSNDGEYDVITIDTSASTAKTVKFASGTSGDKRCCINGIDFLKAAE